MPGCVPHPISFEIISYLHDFRSLSTSYLIRCVGSLPAHPCKFDLCLDLHYRGHQQLASQGTQLCGIVFFQWTAGHRTIRVTIFDFQIKLFLNLKLAPSRARHRHGTHRLADIPVYILHGGCWSFLSFPGILFRYGFFSTDVPLPVTA